MDSIENYSDVRHRRRLTTRIKGSLRDVRSQLALLNRQVGTRLELRDIDFDCLDLINSHGPLSPSALAKQAGLHPATLTGILDRLERAGWIVRERATGDRRAVLVRALPERLGEVYDLLSGMNAAVEDLCADYTPEQLELLADFLHRVTVAGRAAADHLVAG
ncbi:MULTISPECIES: MarR family winged helix-turn-helix transcriptional regulator [Nocardia]|uniref:MarR family transcriptional regulator n=1 Tax=Nocardia sputorum TaxID=2984338 RepID=A0ABM8CRS2_9NOCA|nr:MarR family transcriptional regulator [Nocardia sputorum]BDT95884.1 MarR family transcriptional regulator [Nocardia sputorum]BDT97666.1 MarR family transcriptional regulator [Nocardia sputorum]